MGNESSSIIAPGTKVTLGLVITAAVMAFSVSSWVVSKIEDSEQKVTKKIDVMQQEFADSYASIDARLSKTEQRLEESFDNIDDRLDKDDHRIKSILDATQRASVNRWTSRDTEVWWLRSEKETEQGTGFIDPRLVRPPLDHHE